MTDLWNDKLSEYLDGLLEASEARQLEEHLHSCPACATTLEELRAVVAQAHRLEDRSPSTDLWPGIAARIRGLPDVHRRSEVVSLPEERSRRRSGIARFSFSVPQLAAAAIALMLLSGTSVWLLAPGGAGSASRDRGLALQTSQPGQAAGVSLTRSLGSKPSTLARYQAAIADLEEALFYGDRTLDTATLRTVRHSLGTIDRALDEARRALEADPANPYLNQHVAETMRRKVEFMQTATFMLASS